MNLSSWENRLLNHAINKKQEKKINRLKKTFENRPKWSTMKKNQKVLLLCWSLTKEKDFEINKKEIAKICDCNQKYVNQIFLNDKSVQAQNKKNLIYENFETKFKIKDEKKFYLAFSEKFFISRKPNFNPNDVYEELKEFLSKKEKHIFSLEIEAFNKK